MTAAPYSPVDGVELVTFGEARGNLHILDRKWPVVNVQPTRLRLPLSDGWWVDVPFENGALVLVVADPVGGPENGPIWYASLHHQFGPSPADRFAQEDDDTRPIAGIVDGVLDLHPTLDSWAFHEDPEPEWLIEWLDRVARLECPEQRRAAS